MHPPDGVHPTDKSIDPLDHSWCMCHRYRLYTIYTPNKKNTRGFQFFFPSNFSKASGFCLLFFSPVFLFDQFFFFTGGRVIFCVHLVRLPFFLHRCFFPISSDPICCACSRCRAECVVATSIYITVCFLLQLTEKSIIFLHSSLIVFHVTFPFNSILFCLI